MGVYVPRLAGREYCASVCTCVILALGGAGFEQKLSAHDASGLSPLDARVEHFDIKDGIFEDGVSELSLKQISGLHLGFEVVIRERIQDDARTQSPHFSLHLEKPTVADILDQLCVSDMRYTWSEDGETINIYPRATEDDESYLLNLQIAKITVQSIPDPDQALTPLWQKFPEQQIGYSGPGLGSNTYAKPWTITFKDLTVRQFVNRVAEHTGPETSWIWDGGKGQRFFTFMKGGFHNSWALTESQARVER